MISRRAFLITTLLCLSVLSACLNPYLARLNEIRLDILPMIERQITTAKLEPGAPTFIRIFKEEAILEVWMLDKNSDKFARFKTYPICAFSGKLGPKQREGDHQAPEGFYEVSEDWLWPQSEYHLAMNIGFPNAYDRARGWTGHSLMIHGECESEGCYAMTNPGIEEIYLLVEQSLLAGNDFVPVHIFPFRMTDHNLKRYRQVGASWMPFWHNLREGYDIFEQTRIPPAVQVKNGKYVFRNQILAMKDKAV